MKVCVSILTLFVSLVWSLPLHAKDTSASTLAPLSEEEVRALHDGIQLYQEELWGDALQQLRPLLKSKSFVLQDYLLFMVGRAERQDGQCRKAAPRFVQLNEKYPQSLFADEARLEEAKARLCSKEYGKARTLLNSIAKAGANNHSKEEIRFLIAKSFYLEGKRETAGKLLEEFWIEATVDELAEEAREFLNKMKVPPTRAAKKQRARHLYQLYEWAQAKEMLVELGEQDSFLFAECVFRLKDYKRAKQLFKSLLARKKSTQKVLARLATINARTGDYPEAIRQNRQIAKRYPGTSQSITALKKIAFLYRDDGDFTKAAEVLSGLLNKRLSRSSRNNVMQDLAWVQYRGQQYEAALATLSQLEKRVRGKKDSAQYLFWRGKILLEMEQTEDAKKAFQETWEAGKWTYYGLAALQELHKEDRSFFAALTAEDERRAARIVPVALHRRPLSQSFHLDRAEALHGLGFHRLAANEMAGAYQEAKKSPADLKRIGEIAYMSGNYNVPLLIALQKPQLLDQRTTYWHWMYPAAYEDTISRHAQRRSINPLLLLSMMRQESAFKEHAVSSAGARGLIQIMPFTGRRLARLMGWKGFRVEDLFVPEINIALSALYTQMNSDQFKGRVPLIIASYNAGEGAVARWEKQKGHLTDWEFIEEIPYKETRNYTKKVLRNLWMYRYLYPRYRGKSDFPSST